MVINKKKLIAVCFIMVFSMILAACSGAEEGNSTALPADGEMAAHFIDVGQADCTLVISEGEAMLIDAGNQPDDDLIISYLDSLGIDELKYIVFTHPHEDHIGLREEIEYLDIETEAPYPGDTAQLGECRIEFLGPIYDYDDANDDSICLKITHGENSLLFTGDAGSRPERDMIDEGMDLEADLFHAGHHGSSTSNSYYFLRESNPRYAVISCEKDNMYGHPHEETLSRFNDLGAEVFRTDTQGTIIAVSDGKIFTFNAEGKKADRPYTEDPEEAKYIGNVNSKKYHEPSCSGLPQEENRSYFMTKEAAEKAGFDPCGNCRP